MNRFQKRQEQRRRVFFQSLSSSQIAEIDENGQLHITTFQGYIKRMEPTYYQHSPTFADTVNVVAGSEDERIDLEHKAKWSEPLFADSDHGIELYR